MTNTLRISAIVFSACVHAQTVPLARPVVDRLGAAAARFWDEFQAVTCVEQVEQRKFTPAGKAVAVRKSNFDYLLLLYETGGDLSVEESRIEIGKPQKSTERAFLATSGFSALLLVFHPRYRESFVLEDAGQVQWKGRMHDRVRFRAIPGKQTPSVLVLRDREFPVEWEGAAYADPRTGEIAWITAKLSGSLADIGLETLGAVVEYEPVAVAGNPQLLRLPLTASVTAATKRQRWQNLHAFSKCREFQVSTDAKTETPKEQ